MHKKRKYFTIAKNKNQEIVCADDVKRDSGYFCLECNSELILHRGDKGLRRPHFVHKNTSNCNPETVLHAGFKALVAQKVKENKRVDFEWSCSQCGGKHIMNISEMISHVFVEKSLNRNYRPDVLLTDKNNKPVAVIEVVVTHAPEDHYVDFLKKEGIILIRFDLKNEKDIKKLRQKTVKPTSMEYCTNPKCKKCGKHELLSKMLIITSECWNQDCNSPLNVAVIESENGGLITPKDFSQKDVDIAKEHGAIIRSKFSKTAQEEYLANICLHCNQMIGEHYLFTDHYCEAKNKRCPYVELEFGYRCNCENERKSRYRSERYRGNDRIKNSKEVESILKELKERNLLFNKK